MTSFLACLSILQALSAPLQDTREARIKQFIQRLSSDSPEERIQAVQNLIEVEADQEVAPLLQSTDVEVRELAGRVTRAVSLLRRAPGLKSIDRDYPGLLLKLSQSEKKAWCSTLKPTLEKLKPEERTVLARFFLQEEEIVKVQLAQLQNSVPKMFCGMTSPETKNRARAETEAATQHVKAWSSFYLAALQDERRETRKQVARYMCWVAVHSLDSRVQDDVARALCGTLGDADAEVRSAAAWTLSHGFFTKLDTKTVETLVKGLGRGLKDPDVKMRGACAGSLAIYAPVLASGLRAETAQALVTELEAARGEFAVSLAYSLGQFVPHLQREGLEKAVRALVNTLKKDEANLGAAALPAIVGCVDRMRVELVEEVAAYIVTTAEKALANPKMEVGTSVFTLASSLGPVGSKVQSDALLSQVSQMLLRMIEHPHLKVSRITPAQALAQMGGVLKGSRLEETVDALLAKVRHPDAYVRYACGVALGGLAPHFGEPLRKKTLLALKNLPTRKADEQAYGNYWDSVLKALEKQ